jgi:CheY-like chemotaxis protein
MESKLPPRASQTPGAIDLDFTGVFNLRDLRAAIESGTPPPDLAPAPMPEPEIEAPAAPVQQAPAAAAPAAPVARVPAAPAVAPTPPAARAPAAPAAPAAKPRPVPKDLMVGVKALEEQSYFVNMTRPRAKRTVDPARTMVLLVEDDATTRNILNFILTRGEGYQTRLASDVKGFVAALQKKPLPDVVILDIELPGGVSGFKILQKIRAHPVIRDMPVIIFTGHSEPGDLLQGLALGADAYLSKPAKAEAIFAAIKAVLGG